MTKKKLDNPILNQWLIDLDAVIRHEVLHYIVEQRAIEADEFFFDATPFMTIDQELLNALFIHMDKLDEAEDDIELADLINSVGSLVGLNATKRFLDEHDFLFQVIEKTSINDLSKKAYNTLTSKYPNAIHTVEYLMKETGRSELPQFLKSAKLNENFSIENLAFGNKLEEILIFHKEIITNHRNAKKIYQNKPELTTSNKRYYFIDIEIEKNNNELRLNCNYKIDKISKLNDKHREQVLNYCENLVKHNIDILSSNRENIDKIEMPTPPPEKMLSSRYDGYLPYIIGLYCINNMDTFKELDGLEYNLKFDSFRHFIKSKMFDKFKFIQVEFENWRTKNNTEDYSDDLNTYISEVLSKRYKKNIDITKKLIKEYDELYFEQKEI